MGLRFPTLLPADRRAARADSRRPRAGSHGLGHTARRGRHHAKSCASRNPICCAAMFRRPNLSYSRAPHRRQKRTAPADRPQRRRFRHRLRPHARRQPSRSPTFLRDEGILPQNITTAGMGHAERSLRQEEWISGQDARHGRHQRLRHGHRQARRALRGPLHACATRSKATIRRPAVPDATGSAAMPCC